MWSRRKCYGAREVDGDSDRIAEDNGGQEIRIYVPGSPKTEGDRAAVKAEEGWNGQAQRLEIRDQNCGYLQHSHNNSHRATSFTEQS
jgi:hypothetical protein